MADDRSLDEFMEAEESAEPSASETAAEPVEPAVTEASETEPDGDDVDDGVEPMAETFAWSAAGGECATCGETVEERWRDGDALVCGDCKAW